MNNYSNISKSGMLPSRQKKIAGTVRYNYVVSAHLAPLHRGFQTTVHFRYRTNSRPFEGSGFTRKPDTGIQIRGGISGRAGSKLFKIRISPMTDGESDCSAQDGAYRPSDEGS